MYLVFDDVTKRFGEHEVLTSVRFVLERPGIAGLIGDNGAGKSTLIRLAAGILEPSAGRIRVLNRTPDRNDPDFMGRVGALIEKPGHYDELTVMDNLRYFYSFYHSFSRRLGERRSMDDLVRDQLNRFGLSSVAMQRVGQLSSGYRQRLAIARAMHPWAELLLLDEPFESLDPRARSLVKNVLRECQRAGTSVLFSSHALSDIEQICDQIFLVAHRRVHGFTSFDEIRRRLGGVDSNDLDAVYTQLTNELVA